MGSRPRQTGSRGVTRAFALSDVGRVRQANEDAYALLPERGLFLVSDGMGGEQAGATASKVVVSVLPKMLEGNLPLRDARPPAVLRGILRDALVQLSQNLRRQSSGEPGLSGMGATVVLVYLRGDRGHVAHMGDSRAYLFRGGKLSLLTEDHSVVGLLLRRGEITPEEVRSHPAHGKLTRFVGMEEVVYPDVRSFALKAGDRLLLCTDGLTGMVDDEALARLLAPPAEPKATCRSLIDAANAGGGVDNITALVIDWIGERSSLPAAARTSAPPRAGRTPASRR